MTDPFKGRPDAELADSFGTIAREIVRRGKMVAGELYRIIVTPKGEYEMTAVMYVRTAKRKPPDEPAQSRRNHR